MFVKPIVKITNKCMLYTCFGIYMAYPKAMNDELLPSCEKTRWVNVCSHPVPLASSVCVRWNAAVCGEGIDPDASASSPVSLSGTARWLTASARLPPRNGSSQRHVPAVAAATGRRPCGCAWACERKARVAAGFPGYRRHLETRSREVHVN